MMGELKPPIPHTTTVRLAALAYEDYSDVEEGAIDLDMKLTKFLDRDGTQAYLFENERAASLTVTGTQFSRGRLNDLISNAGFFARSWEGPGKVHRGYLEQFEDIEKDVLEIYNSVASEKPFIIDGHSLGGSVANIIAAKVTALKWKCKGLVTFGAPKSLDQTAANTILEKIPVWRFTNRFDFANGFPPTPYLVHPGPERRLNSGGSWWPLARHTPDNFIRAIDRRFK